MDEDNIPLWIKVLIALTAGVFGLAIAVRMKYIQLKPPYYIVWIVAVTHLVMSLGIFLMVMLFFSSGLLPTSVPNDDYTALTIAYLMSSTPQVTISLIMTIYNKEVNKWLESRYGNNQTVTINKDDATVTDNSLPIKDSEPTDHTSFHDELVDQMEGKLPEESIDNSKVVSLLDNQPEVGTGVR